ncbi:hypothetical protein NKF26_11985 [Haladaptatus sp. AB618]|uniref:hypothetical protein n=1 Tax=Haladaptatus sp. AB618 TaxID=2934173 RepID=UPI00209C5536|nr:hypothetical protein [Haladaptatus sp. AB618]MCO8254522.1 hypothetical protein [Haladaptatus sp. AB618]
MSKLDGEDPLEKVLVNKDEINRQRLADGIKGIIGVDEASGKPTPLSGYQNLNNKQRFVARLLARRAAHALDLLDDESLGDSSSGFEDRMAVTGSTIKDYGSIDFVENDGEYGGYHIPAYGLAEAIEFIQETEEKE